MNCNIICCLSLSSVDQVEWCRLSRRDTGEAQMKQAWPMFSHSSIFILYIPHFPMHSGRECMSSALSHSAAPFSMHIEQYVWMSMASGLPRRRMPKQVTRPSTQFLHPIYLSLLPMTRHVEMDTEAPLHIDSGSRNSQARGGLSPASSLHFLYVRERETARDWVGDNVSRQKSIFCSHLYSTSARAECSATPNVSFGGKGQELSNKKAKEGTDWITLWFWKVYMWTIQRFMSMGTNLRM